MSNASTLRSRRILVALAALLALVATVLPTSAGAAEISLASYRNNVGICQHPLHSCNFDGGGFSYSTAALAVAGVRGGNTIQSGGFSFTWPNVQAGQADNVEMKGQVIPVLAGNATKIGFLAAAHNAPVTAGVKLHYTFVDEDGELQETVVTSPLLLSDWTLNAGGSQPSAGNTTVITTRFRVNGTTVEQVPTHVFVASIAIDPTMSLQTIEFPNNDKVHVFGLALA